MAAPYIKGEHYCDIFYNNCWAELIFTPATINFKLPNQADVFKVSIRIIYWRQGTGHDVTECMLQYEMLRVTHCRLQVTGGRYLIVGAGPSACPIC